MGGGESSFGNGSVPSKCHEVQPEVAICFADLVQIARQEEQAPMIEVVDLVVNAVSDVAVAPGEEASVQHAERRAKRDA